MQKLFSCLFGSGLYGTRTPTSDLDVKHVCLPDLNDLLLGKKVTNVVKKTNTAQNTKNSVDDVDEEFIPLQVFARDFMMGQTYALELAFAVDFNAAEQTFYSRNGAKLPGRVEAVRDYQFEETDYEEVEFIGFVKELRKRFLTSNIKAMMGYVVNQASLYSFKGERLNASRDFMKMLQSALILGETDQKSLAEILEIQEGQNFKETGLAWDAVEMEKKYPKYFKVSEYDIGGGRMRPCYVLLEKVMPHTMKLPHAVEVTSNLIKKYGSRADAASETNVDWKATMHALRIVDEGLSLLEHHTLKFPFEADYVAKLLSIKRGEVPLADVTKELTEKLDRLKELEKTTSLPAYDQRMQQQFDDWMAVQLRKFYDLR